VWEDLPSQIRLQLEDELAAMRGAGDGSDTRNESKAVVTASLFTEKPLPPPEQAVLDRLRHDESLQLDELIEGLDGELGSSEIFAALFELELAGRIKQLPGKNYVRSF
jgi:DNA processing protein